MRFKIEIENDRYEIPVYERGYTWGYGLRFELQSGGVEVSFCSWTSTGGILQELRRSEGLTEKEIRKLPSCLRKKFPDNEEVRQVAARIESGLLRERRLNAVAARNVAPSGHFIACGMFGVELCNPDGGRVWQIPAGKRGRGGIAVGRAKRQLLFASLAAREPQAGVRQTLCRWPSALK